MLKKECKAMSKQGNKYTEYSKGNLIKWLEKLAVQEVKTAQNVKDVKLLLLAYPDNTVLSPAESYKELCESYSGITTDHEATERRWLAYAVCTEIKTWIKNRGVENLAARVSNDAKQKSAAAKLFTGLIILSSFIAVVSTVLSLSHVISFGGEISAAVSCLGLVFGVTFFLYNGRTNAKSASIPVIVKEILDNIDRPNTVITNNNGSNVIVNEGILSGSFAKHTVYSYTDFLKPADKEEQK
jgi:hypothetical protein